MNRSKHSPYSLQQLFEPPAGVEFQQVLNSSHFERTQWDFFGRATLILDKFPDAEGASCCFVRLPIDEERVVRFVVQGVQLESCSSGGWLLRPIEATVPSYWIPQPPVLRTFDPNGRILSEESASIVGIKASSKELTVEFKIPNNMHLDWTLWRFPPEASHIQAALDQPLVLEKQPIFFWTSQTIYQAPADLYLYLVHGHVYANRFIWPRNWKICSELDAYGLYVTLSGLELTTNKKIYGLLKRQILFNAKLVSW